MAGFDWMVKKTVKAIEYIGLEWFLVLNVCLMMVMFAACVWAFGWVLAIGMFVIAHAWAEYKTGAIRMLVKYYTVR